MKKLFLRRCIILFCLLPGNLLWAQQDYEVFFLKGAYDVILEKSQKSETPQDYYWNALILDKQGRTPKAIDVLETGLIKFEGNSLLETLLSDYLFKTGHYSKAEPLLAKHSDDPARFQQYIQVLEQREAFERAIELLQSRSSEDTSRLEYLIHLGDDYFQIDSLERAIEVYSRILSMNPNDQLTASKLANLFIKIQENKKAIEICDIGLASDSTYKKLIRLKGVASFNANDFKTAEICFNKLYEQGDTGKFVLKHLGIARFDNRSFQDARTLLLQAFRLDSNDVEVCFMLGKCYLNSPEPEKALYFLDRADSLLQPDPTVLAALCIEKQSVYSAIDRYEDALLCYQKAYGYDPKPEYVFYMASIYQNRLNKPKNALEQYERFLELLPEAPDTSLGTTNKDQITISLKSVAEKNITSLKEELFFKGEMKEN